MGTFNLKKYAEEQKAQEKQLDEVRENEKKPGQKPINELLEKKRDDKEEVKTTEDQLKDVRKEEAGDKTIEALIDDVEASDEYPTRTGKDKFDQLPINLLEEAQHQEKIKAYKASNEKSDIKSQLHNHSDRFKKLKSGDVLNNTKVKEMVMASLKDADAMLYFIYRKAASDKRDLTAEEQKLVDGITNDKISLTNKLYE